MSARDYEELAHQVLDLGADALAPGDGGGDHLGTITLGGSPAVFEAVVARRLEEVRRYFARKERELAAWAVPRGLDDYLARLERERRLAQWRQELTREAERFSFFSYSEYLTALRRSERPAAETGNVARDAAERVFRRLPRHRYSSDPEGYRRYLADVAPEFDALLRRELRVRLPEADLLRHVYVVATTESGKSELLKLITHLILGRDAAAVLLDPHGDLAEQIARFREFADTDRLIYLDPRLSSGSTPTLNPLQVQGPFRDTEHELEVKAVIAAQIADGFAEMLGREPGVVTGNMQALLEPSLTLLLDTPGATLRDLQRLMDNRRNGDLIERGTRARYGNVREFFAHRFRDRGYDASRDALARRLDRLFSSQAFERLTCGESTIDLQRALAQRKMIVVNLAEGRLPLGAAEAFGRLLIAALRGIAFRRVDEPEEQRVPVHLIVDEAQTFITASLFTILGQTRKFKLYAVLSQLMPGHGMSAEERALLLDTTKTKFIGQSTGGQAQRESAALSGVAPEELDGLERGGFFVKRQGRPAFKFRTAARLLGHTHSMGEQEWARLRQAQLASYYRPYEVAAAPEATAPVSEPPQEKPARGEPPGRARKKPPQPDRDAPTVHGVLRPARKRV